MNNQHISYVASFFLVLTFLIGLTSAVCCEKTVDGNWCQNAEQDQCATNFGATEYKVAPTSCDQTTFCSVGTCIDTNQGKCIDNTAQRTCQEQGGVWDSRNSADIVQCQLGCCRIGEQSSWTEQANCKKLATLYGVETTFRLDIASEELCIATSEPRVKGACVLDSGIERTCALTTREACQTLDGSNGGTYIDRFEFEPAEGVSTSFYEDTLCTDETLGTNCARSEKTTCVEDKDQVYFVDTCGNIANVYDASKVNDQNYWSDLIDPVDSCELNANLGNAARCGNCDYISGSICAAYERGENTKPSIGEYVCQDLSCSYDTNGNNEIDSDEVYQHGERWCAIAPGINKDFSQSYIPNPREENLVGSEYYRLVCYNGEVTVEPCASYRQEVCVESTIETPDGVGFRNAVCKPNLWETCLGQTEQEDCEDATLHDCRWINSGRLKPDLSDEHGQELNEKINRLYDMNREVVERRDVSTNMIEGWLGIDPETYFEFVCVPKYAPGYEFWEPQTTKQSGEQVTDMCSVANEVCYYTTADDIFGQTTATIEDCGKDEGNCHCVPVDDNWYWLALKENMCLSLGDCGSSVNYLKVEGGDSWDVTRSDEL